MSSWIWYIVAIAAVLELTGRTRAQGVLIDYIPADEPVFAGVAR